MRKCRNCGVEKPLGDFGADRRAVDGCKAKCRPCEKAYNLAWQRANRDHVRAKNAAWVKANPEKKRAIESRRDPAKISAYQRSERGRRLGRERKRREYERRRQAILARSSAWNKANRHKIRERTSTPHRRLHGNVSRAIRAAIRLNKDGRGWESLVGYTRSDLIGHLEKQFAPGMTWDNYGQWEIDHIRPRSSFSFTTAEEPQFKECWALTNLQPLWMSDNRKKHARYEVAA